jgi:GxxExxY protein
MEKGKYAPIPDVDERIAKCVVHAAYTVHKKLGPGLLERVYETCFCYELSKQGVDYAKQITLPVTYDGITFDEGMRPDVLVGGRIICELKAVEEVHPVHLAQLLTYLKLSNRRLGFLINFNVPIMKEGIKRVVL